MKTAVKKLKMIDVLLNIHSNKVVLPSFQRDFVWTKQQVLAIFDSLMLGYPISTFLFWNIEDIDFKNNSYFYQFLKEVTFSSQGQTNQSTDNQIYVPEKNTIAVLDGQQRLTSLYIALLGRIFSKAKFKKSAFNKPQVELYLDLESGNDFFDDEDSVENDDDEITKDSHGYTFVFQLYVSNPNKKKWFKVRDIIPLREESTRESEINRILSEVDKKNYENAKKNLNLMAKRIFDDDIINISELSQCGLNEALEIFIRFNRGGTKLSKSDLVFSTIESRWPTAKEKIESFLKNINRKYSFKKDFIVRLALVLFGRNIDIQKTSVNNGIVEELRKNWNKIISAINVTIKFLSEDCGITSDREISSYISIIPIVYSVYNNDGQIKNKDDIKKYIYRSLILNIFSSKTNSLLVELKNSIKECDFFINIDDIQNRIHNFKVGDDKLEQILEYEKSYTTQLILFLIGNNNVFCSKDESEYHQDHIHASDIFDGDNNKPQGISDKTWIDWGKKKNKIPNLQLLKGKPNKSKSNKKLTHWLDSDGAPTETEFRKQLNLPEELSLELKDFEIFYSYRKNLLKEDLKKMLL